MGAVVRGIFHRIVVGSAIRATEIPSAVVVDVAVVIVIKSVVFDLVGVYPNVSYKVGVIPVNSGIINTDNYGRRALINIPGFRGFNFGEVPLLIVEGIVWHKG